MYLLPLFSLLGQLAGRIFYRLRIVGDVVPREGPALLVANHPNSLMDPVLVIGAAGRRVRFLAKAPLFSDKMVGWLVRGSGAVPVYRKVDDPEHMERNVEMFSAVQAALEEGDAVGIFPEGVSHSEPALVPFKTGTARIALGAAPRLGGAFPIVPVGLVFRAKHVFRSSALIVVGSPIEWSKLAARADEDRGSGVPDPELVQELTQRIRSALRRVTINLEDWADAPVVESALDVWETEFGASRGVGRVTRMGVTAALLRRLRMDRAPEVETLVSELVAHARRLGRLHLRPQDLERDTGAPAAIRWSARRLVFVSVPLIVTALAGFVLFWVPYQFTGRVAERRRPDLDRVSTHKLLAGIVVYGTWIVLLAAVGGFVHPLVGFAIIVLAPVIGFVGLQVREQWRGAWADVRSFLLLRSRRRLVATLSERQRDLARRLDGVYRAHGGTPS